MTTIARAQTRGRRRIAAIALAVQLATSSFAAAEEWAETSHGGVRVVAFDKRETRRLFGIAGTLTIAFDGYAADVQAVLVLTTKRGPCVDSGSLDGTGALPVIRLAGRCHGISGLILGPRE
jgi:hypothetical protein